MPKIKTNSWQPIIDLFLFKIQKCSEFFNYYNVTKDEAMELAIRRSKGYLMESVSRLTSMCSPDVDFHDYDPELEMFNFEITNDEIDLFANLMYEMFLSKDTAKLVVRSSVLTSQDIKAVYGVGYNERNSFMSMFEKIQSNNSTLIDGYISKDRLTGKRKLVEYNM